MNVLYVCFKKTRRPQSWPGGRESELRRDISGLIAGPEASATETEKDAERDCVPTYIHTYIHTHTSNRVRQCSVEKKRVLG